MNAIDEAGARKALSVIKPENQLFEVRLIYGNKSTYSGYFNNADSLIKAFCGIRDYRDCNIYITLNTLNDACYDRVQKDRFEKNPKATTSDNDVVSYDWLMIDLDPKRPAGTSATNEQIEKAKEKCNKIYAFMRDLGFNAPVIGFSGNGIHLLYRINAKNTSENIKVFEMSLKTLNMLFSDNEIEVDMKNFNPSRVCKLYGTLAQKGTNSAERPHRMSGIVKSPDTIVPTDIIYLKKLCAKYPKEERPQKYNNYHPRDFNLDEWLSKNGLSHRKTVYADGTKYILECCPFDSNHKGKDACIFQSRNGAIGFHCFHNSCSGKTWKDVRLLYEPDAYEKKNQEYERVIYSKGKFKSEPLPKIEPTDGNPVFYTATDILNMPVKDEEFVKTGIDLIDRKMRGLKKGYVTVISGMRAAGKSSVISGICLDCVQTGGNVCVFSGELAPKNFMRWMNLQAAGKGFTEPTQFENYYNVTRKNQERIAEWLEKHFFLYNNDYGNNYLALVEQFEKCIENNKLDLLILDNLMALDIEGMAENEYNAQKEFVLNLQTIAKKHNVHIMFVAHPRKAMGFLRLDDISGTAHIGNAVDNAFIVHRVNNDFKRLSKQMFGWKDDNPLYEATNVIEIAKDRDGGIQDFFIPLYYEAETKRLRNSRAENKIYGWRQGEIVEVERQEMKHEQENMVDDSGEWVSLEGVNEESPFGRLEGFNGMQEV